MRWFHKKRDPISERARQLEAQIGTLESQIARLSSQLETQPAESVGQTQPAPAAEPADKRKFLSPPPPAQAGPSAAPHPAPAAEPPPATPSAAPRLRSTALPHGPTVASHPASGTAGELIFEPVAGNPFKGDEPSRPALEPPELGVRKPGWQSLWERLKRQVRGPSAANPKLVSYLAAGSLQGLQPLRYEKRVARNRFIALLLVLALVVSWLLYIFVRR